MSETIELGSIETDVQTKVYNLTVELANQEALKKSAVQAFNEEIKRIKAEIKDLIKEDQEEVEEQE